MNKNKKLKNINNGSILYKKLKKLLNNLTSRMKIYWIMFENK